MNPVGSPTVSTFNRVLNTGKLREIVSGTNRPLFIFTDASFEPAPVFKRYLNTHRLEDPIEREVLIATRHYKSNNVFMHPDMTVLLASCGMQSLNTTVFSGSTEVVDEPDLSSLSEAAFTMIREIKTDP